MTTLANVTVSSDDWIDIALTAGVQGSAFQMQNVSMTSYSDFNRVLMFKSNTKPSASAEDGHILYPAAYGPTSFITHDGTEKLWVKANSCWF